MKDRKQVFVAAPGTKVSIADYGDGGIAATIIGVAIYSERIMYQVRWWDGRQSRNEWLDAFEVYESSKEHEKISVGLFTTGDK